MADTISIISDGKLVVRRSYSNMTLFPVINSLLLHETKVVFEYGRHLLQQAVL